MQFPNFMKNCEEQHEDKEVFRRASTLPANPILIPTNPILLPTIQSTATATILVRYESYQEKYAEFGNAVHEKHRCRTSTDMH